MSKLNTKDKIGRGRPKCLPGNCRFAHVFTGITIQKYDKMKQISKIVSKIVSKKE